MDLRDWENPDPADILVLDSDQKWKDLTGRYATQHSRPFARCLEVARSAGASSVVIETRYIDLDYRSEYSAFYSKTFEWIPDSAHRLHFFKVPLTREQLWNLPADPGYLGYMVVRPSELGLVGRTMLSPPPGMETALRALVEDTVNFFGRELSVWAMPFVQQDTQLGRCAHAAAWMCHYMIALRGDVARREMADFSLRAEPALGVGRPLPSEGLTVHQLLELFRVFDLPPRFYSIASLPIYRTVPWAQPNPTPPSDPAKQDPGYWDSRIIPICCRYLNSGFPVLVATRNHAFVLCGYERQPRKGEPDWITFVRHDDQRGPYLTVDNVFEDKDSATGYEYSPWKALIVPLPDKLWLPPEPAEYEGGMLMKAFAERFETQIPDLRELLTMINEDNLSLHTYALTANRFKQTLDRGMDKRLAIEYRLARFSRFVWVVEAVNRELRREGKQSVVGEVVFDATSSEFDPRPLAYHAPGLALVQQTGGDVRFPIRVTPDAYTTGAYGPP